MARFYLLPVVLLILLLAVPAAPVAAGTGTPAAPADPPSTFNVTRLGVYDYPPNYDGGHVTADGDQAFLTNGTTVNLYDITDPYAPSFRDSIPGDTGYGVIDIDAKANRLARLITNSGIDIVLRVYDVSGGAFAPRCSLHFDWGTWSFPDTVQLSSDGRYAYVGFSLGMAVVDVENPVNGQCQVTAEYNELKRVDDIVQVGNKLYLAENGDVLVFWLNNPAYPNYDAMYPVDGDVYRVAVSSNGAIFAATLDTEMLNQWGLTIIYDGAYGTYPQANRISVVADGFLVYVGTDQDLQVIDAGELQKPLPIKLPLIGRYGDYYGRFYADLAVNRGLEVHSPKGIFQFQADLWLQALSSGITKNGTPVQEGTGVTITEAGSHVGVSSPDGKAALAYRCSESNTKTVVNLQGRDRTAHWPLGMISIGLGALAELGADECGITLPSPPSASPEADPPVLPLTLESGGLEFDVLTTVDDIQVATTNASNRAAGGTRFEAAHDPDLGRSHFVCLAGTLQVQPTAAGASLLTLAPGQFVDVTAAGAGPIGQLRYVYLPLVLR
jgi:hypothetical protein